jgi:hypothetical protein
MREFWGKIPEFLGPKCGGLATLLGGPVGPRAQIGLVFSHCNPSIASLTFTYIEWSNSTRKDRSSLLKKPSTHPLPPHFSSKSLVHPLPCHGPLPCFVHRYNRKEDPTIEKGTTRQGYVVCFGRINRPREGLRCCEGGHRRSRRTIGEDGRPAMVCGHAPPPHVLRANHHQCAKVPLVPEAVKRTWFVLFPLVQRSGRSTDRSCQHVPLRGSSL